MNKINKLYIAIILLVMLSILIIIKNPTNKTTITHYNIECIEVINGDCCIWVFSEGVQKDTIRSEVCKKNIKR